MKTLLATLFVVSASIASADSGLVCNVSQMNSGGGGAIYGQLPVTAKTIFSMNLGATGMQVLSIPMIFAQPQPGQVNKVQIMLKDSKGFAMGNMMVQLDSNLKAPGEFSFGVDLPDYSKITISCKQN